jgi:hypothetical protein
VRPPLFANPHGRSPGSMIAGAARPDSCLPLFAGHLLGSCSRVLSDSEMLVRSKRMFERTGILVYRNGLPFLPAPARVTTWRSSGSSSYCLRTVLTACRVSAVL